MSIESISEPLEKAPRQQKGDGRRGAAAALDRLPPHSEEAERGVLGCVLYAPETALETLNACQEAGMEARWFYDLRHQIIFSSLQKMAAGSVPLDMMTLIIRLKADGALEQCSGVEYLTVLQDAVPSAANIGYYLEIVREKWQLRQLVATCAELTGRVYEFSGKVDELMGSVERQILEVTGPAVKAKERHIKAVLPEVIDDLENYHKGKVQLQGLPTGFEYLDKVIGGVGNDWYWVLAGRPGSGKTTFALDVINHLATDYEWWRETGEKHENGEPKMVQEKGIPIGVFSLEMSSKSLGKRLLFSMARVSAGKFKQGFMSNGDFQNLINAMPKLSTANIYLDEEPSQTIGKIRAKAQRMARQYGIKLFVLDYLQLVLPDNRSGRIDRVQELADISAQIVYLKKKLGIPWLVLAQMNRNIETSERIRVPVLSDLKDCGCIEQDADVVQFLHKPGPKETEQDDEILNDAFAGVEFSERPRRIDAVLAKNRDGATGIAKLLFHSNRFHFEDWRKWKVANGYEEAAKGESYKRPQMGTDETQIENE
jgi:replicative DNA helicase